MTMAAANPGRVRDPARTRALAFRIFRFAALAFLIIWPWYKSTFVHLGYADVALVYVIVAASLVMLTGWVGQISLAQAAFVGIGAFVTSMVAGSLHLGFPLSTVVSGFAAAGAAALMGMVALRVRGLYLAVATLVFSWMCDAYLFLSRWFSKGGGSVSVTNRPVGVQGTFPYFDLTNRRTFYYVGLAVAAMVLFALTNLRDSRTGRAMFAVRGSEVAAASLGVNVTRYKLLAFSLAGMIAGIGGNLLALFQGSLTPDQFKFTQSFFYLAIAVVAGLHSLWGAVAAAALFGALDDVFFRIPALNGYSPLVAALLLVVVLLAYPGGMAAVPDSARRLWARLRSRRVQAVADGSSRPPREPGEVPEWAAMGFPILSHLVGWIVRLVRRPSTAVSGGRLLPLTLLGLEEEEVAVEEIVAATDADADAAVAVPVPSAPRRARPQGGDRGPSLLEARNIIVRFGGLTAVDNVSLEVHEGEIVGLIGPNGAGKTTLFNAIAGLNRPTEGSVHIFGVDATALAVHERAALGVGRTFQAIQLLTDLTVFDNLLVATHLQNDTGFVSHMAVTRRALVAEHGCRQLVTRVIDMLGLTDVAHRKVSGLPFGTLRMVEIARALVTRSPLIMLDEPASGLDNAETDRLAELLFFLRDTLGVSILLIEHDVALVTRVCDHAYVIDRGKPISSGPTSEVQRDPKVIAAYLGTEAGADAADATESESDTDVAAAEEPDTIQVDEVTGELAAITEPEVAGAPG
jgi:ABC-type branched-subunit amino acid transport system ATPase component/ABC-type branched-subunit amino acid transport system permease subunit